jgi:hypothetical protein
MKEKIEEILIKHDPVKLIAMEAPLDEYRQESILINECVTRHFSTESIHKIVYDIFIKQFGGERFAPSIVGPFESYLPIATEIKNLLDEA